MTSLFGLVPKNIVCNLSTGMNLQIKSQKVQMYLSRYIRVKNENLKTLFGFFSLDFGFYEKNSIYDSFKNSNYFRGK